MDHEKHLVSEELAGRPTHCLVCGDKLGEVWYPHILGKRRANKKYAYRGAFCSITCSKTYCCTKRFYHRDVDGMGEYMIQRIGLYCWLRWPKLKPRVEWTRYYDCNDYYPARGIAKDEEGKKMVMAVRKLCEADAIGKMREMNKEDLQLCERGVRIMTDEERKRMEQTQERKDRAIAMRNCKGSLSTFFRPTIVKRRRICKK